MKSTTLRNTVAALSVVVAIGGSAAQAAGLDNREIGHSTPRSGSAEGAQLVATGINNSQLGHFALQASRPASNSTADSGGVISGSEDLPR